MAEPINWKEITTAFKGRMIMGSYAVEDKIVRVKTTLGEKEAQIEGNSPVFVAWRLLRELAGQEKA